MNKKATNDKTIAELQDTIIRQQTQIEEITALAQKTRADFENYRKHTEQDIARAEAASSEKTIKKLLPILDILDTAVGNVPEDLVDDNWVQGIIGAQKNIQKTISDLVLEKQPVQIGDAFDHNKHEAILYEDGDGSEECVVEILRPGYIYNGEIIRPAMVKVAKK